MTDIEVKRKELETAKRIRAGGYFCGFGPGTVKCIEDCCPGKNESATECSHWQELEWDAFISTREAELAALEETPDLTPKPGYSGCTIGVDPIGPTLDDFALALIQGGYFNMTMGEDAAISNLVSRAEKIKAALDARRGI